MTAADIISRATADGVKLTPTLAGTLKVTGDQSAIDRWLPALKAHKPDIIAALTELPPALERRIRTMARRWEYLPGELEDVIERARRDPAGWTRAVSLDERREAEFRELGILPKADA